MEIDINEVHVGRAIKQRMDDLRMSKAEFAKQMGIQQQHVNRILERDTMETKKLVGVCRILDFNIFALFCKNTPYIHAYLAAVSTSGNASNNIGDAALAAEKEIAKINLQALQEKNQLISETSERRIEQMKDQIEVMKDQIQTLKDIIEQFKDQIKDKNDLISALKSSVTQ